MKTIKVVAAVICDPPDKKQKIFATARGYGEFKLATKICVGDLITTVEYDYPAFHLSMDCFWCEVVEGELKLLEAEDARWLTKDKLYSVKWLPADVTLIAEIEKSME